MGNESANGDFDEILVRKFSFEFDFDESKLNKFLAKANMDLDTAPEQALYELGCGKLVGNEFTVNNAGILFFAREPQKFVKQSYITCARYQGTGMASVIDRKDLQGDLLSLVDEAEAFVKRHTRLAYRFDGFKRIDIEEYPYDAIKEAIINAACHRNYFLENNIFVNVFDDRVEVISPGNIPNNLSLKDVQGKSIPRNFIIVDLFKKAGYIEKPGSGLKRMDELMMLHGLKKPIYDVSKVFFQVTFHGPKERILDLVKPSNEIDLRELGLNERQIKLLNFLSKEQKKINSKQYREMFNVGKNTTNLDLTKLIESGFIQSEGRGKATRYSLK